ncbi:MAG: hypothetical protein A2Y33_03850 [Spirochaetes bacterium GWF1_51_8]|nr:MAG: hypothetical protein A2Y33_03850 [Spirochaetes bacterium GWF1_51_8]
MRNLAVFLLFFLFAGKLFAYNEFEFIKELTISDKAWKVYTLENLVQSVKAGNRVYILKETKVTNSEFLDLYLDFEKPLQNLPNYKVIASEYETNPYENTSGKNSGKFYFNEHHISLLPFGTSMFSPGKIPGSFTIEFWLYLYKGFDNQYVIKYLGYNPSDEWDKNTYGYSIYVKNKKVIYSFNNFFWSIDNEPYSLQIEEEEQVILHKWEHHAISYNIMNGQISTYKNGIEQQVKWVTTDGKVLSPIYNPYVKDELSTPLVIGKNAFFSLDDLKISSIALDYFNMNRFDNNPGILITDVYKMTENIATLKKIVFGTSVPDLSHVKFAYRISSSYFLPGDPVLEWVYVQNNTDVFPAEYAKGKYIQFKILVYPYEDNQKVLSIDSIKLSYSMDDSPQPPILISAVPGNGSVKVTWMPSVEEDVAGYEIYYGTHEKNYICDDSFSGKSPVFVPYKQSGKLKTFDFTLTGMMNETPYFIAIKSVDANGNRSVFSKEFYVRPSTVYKENGYSVGE